MVVDLKAGTDPLVRRGIKSPRLLLTGAVVLVMGLFIGFSALHHGPGFPLDDAWIHQTYARNLARNGRWEYVSGVVSAGSTAPLWTLLLAIGYLLRFPYLLWTYLLGGLSLLWLGIVGMRLWRCLWPEQANKDWVAGLVLVFTWPLIWAAASGMETLLFAALGLNVLALYGEHVAGNGARIAATQPKPTSLRFPLILGILSGLLILIRPDGLVLLLLLAFGLSLTSGSLPNRVGSVAVFLGATVLPLVPYFAFNMATSGSVWPNTFYAKQTEYAILLTQSLPGRLSRLLFFSMGGPPEGLRGISSPHLLLLPGLVVAGWRGLKIDWCKRQFYHLVPLLWAGGHILIYAWRLPVTYQHGRYLLAAIPVWILYGLAGWQHLLSAPSDSNYVVRVSRRVATLTFVALLLVFLLLGAQAYANDVAFIQGEMVDVAHWLAHNTPPDAVIAAHDIGAIGYFAERPLLDLAGLLSPELIPLLSDKVALAQYVINSEADYLVTAPGWPYRVVTESDAAVFVYATDFNWTREQELNNMTVYELAPP